MSALWTAAEIAAATGGSVRADFTASGVTFDSREVGPSDLFVALRGDTTDGHRFIDKALAAGAAGVVASGEVAGPHVRVADTTRALDDLGRASRARTEARIVGVTGSVGKTGTKEALFTALDRASPGAAHRSVKSYNNHTGVPLSLARMPAASQFGVFELGMNHAGELSALTRLVRPHVAIVTAIAPAHRAFFASDEAIADAKGEIFEGLEEGGTALVPFDSPHRDRLIGAARPYAAKILTFGTAEGSDIRAVEAFHREKGTLVTARLPEGDLTFTLSQKGAHWVSNAMAVLGAVAAVGGDLALAGLALSDMKGLPGRGARHRIETGGGEALLIDESYNANPVSMAATLRTFGDAPTSGRRMAILGDMRELGESAPAYHASLASPVEEAGVDWAILVGEEMSALAKALGQKVKISHVPNAAAALELVRGEIGPGDSILVKGSNGVGLSAVVAALVDGPLDAKGDR